MILKLIKNETCSYGVENIFGTFIRKLLFRIVWLGSCENE